MNEILKKMIEYAPKTWIDRLAAALRLAALKQQAIQYNKNDRRNNMERDLEDLGITISHVKQARELLKKLAKQREQGLPLSVFGVTYAIALIDPIIKGLEGYDKKETDVLLKKIKRGIDLNEATELLEEYRKTKMVLLWINQGKEIEFAPGGFIPKECNPGIKRVLEDYKKELEGKIMGHEE